MRHYTLIIILFISSCDTLKSDNVILTQINVSNKTLAIIYTEKGKYGLMDTNKNVILRAQFDYIEDWQVDNLIRVDSGGKKISGDDVVGYNFKKYGLINVKGEILFRPKFDELIIANNSALVKVDSLFGFVDDKGNWIIKPKYKVAFPFYKGVAIVKEEKYFYLMNKEAKKLINISFDTIYNFKNGIAVTQKDKKWGLLNYYGNFILPLDFYEGVGEFNWNFGEFRKNGKSYLIDTSGNIPVKEGFEEVQIDGDDNSVFANGKQNGKTVRIRLK